MARWSFGLSELGLAGVAVGFQLSLSYRATSVHRSAVRASARSWAAPLDVRALAENLSSGSVAYVYWKYFQLVSLTEAKWEQEIIDNSTAIVTENGIEEYGLDLCLVAHYAL